MKPGYKQTEIGVLPEEWDVVRLGNPGIAEIRGNKSIKDANSVAFIPMGLVPDHGVYCTYLVRDPNDVKSATYCRAGDLLLAKITPSLENGKQGIVPLEVPGGFAFATTEVFPIACKGVDKLYLFYSLKFPKHRNKLVGSMIGTTGRQRATKSAVKRLQIPIPPLPEQKKIAEVLSTVDEAIEKADLAIEKTERLKRGLMQELLTKGIGYKEFKDTEIGRIPKEWKVEKLDDAIEDFISGGTPSTKEPAYWGGEIPWITSAYINDFYLTSGIKCITQEGLQNSATNIVPKDNILIATRVGVGKVAVNLIDIAISQDLTGAVIDKEKVLPRFLCWYMVSPKMQNLIQSFVRGSTIKGIARSELTKIRVPIPSLSEQKKIAGILSTVDRRLELFRKKKDRLGRVKRGLMNDLLTGKCRVHV